MELVNLAINAALIGFCVLFPFAASDEVQRAKGSEAWGFAAFFVGWGVSLCVWNLWVYALPTL